MDFWDWVLILDIVLFILLCLWHWRCEAWYWKTWGRHKRTTRAQRRRERAALKVIIIAIVAVMMAGAVGGIVIVWKFV